MSIWREFEDLVAAWPKYEEELRRLEKIIPFQDLLLMAREMIECYEGLPSTPEELTESDRIEALIDEFPEYESFIRELRYLISDEDILERAGPFIREDVRRRREPFTRERT